MSNPNLMDIGGFVRDWYRNATERRELLALEDRGLRDIGITRAEAIAEASRPLWRRRPAAVAPVPLRVDPEAIRRHVDRAHALRAKAMGDLARRVMHWLSGRSAPQPSARTRKLAPVAR
jgi:uncharacterized protein YjiS (DUF1127 family)